MIGEREILSAKILIVDDESANILVLRRMLEVAGYTKVRTTTDSREAAGIYRVFRPDLVLLDLRMPRLNGFEVMEQLNEIEQESYPPILVLTVLNDKPTMLRALKSGAKDFIIKPFDHTEALARIRNMVQMRILQKRIFGQNKILEETVREQTQQLRTTQLQVVRHLGRAVEFRDNETGLHVVRMSLYCSLVGLAMGMGIEACETLLNASPMHDIGKIGIPDRILMKKGKLTQGEWKIMQGHVNIGAEILADHDSELLDMAHRIALTHHERVDGSGYPEGLKGVAIPLEGRVAGVCDVFDALTSERPYKEEWPVKKAMSVIERGKGRQFDADLIDAFRDTLPQILEVKEQYSEPVQED
ncbi:MAG: HD domain-containing phosphohydrolase [bacterium]